MDQKLTYRLGLDDADFSRGMSGAQREIKQLNNSTKTGNLGSLSGEMQLLSGSTSNFTAQAGGANRSLTGLLDNIKSGAGGLSGLAAGFTGVTIVIGAFTAANASAQSILATVAPYDSLVRGLRTLEGTAENTTRRIETLRDVAKTPGLGFAEAVQADIRLRAVGLSAQTSEDALKAFGNALATVGGGKADLDGVILALTQMAAKGKVSAEEINQIAERVPQVRQAMKDAFGTSDTEALGKAGIDATSFISGLIAELQKLPQATGGAQNELDNYSDAWANLKVEAASFASGLAGPWLSSITRTFDGLRRDLKSLKELFGIEDTTLTGPDVAVRDRQAEAEAAQQAEAAVAEYHRQVANEQAYQEGQKNAQKYWDYVRDRAAEAEADQIRRADSAFTRALTAQDAFRRATLSPEEYLKTQLAELKKQGPSDEASYNKATGEEKYKIAERLAQIHTLETEIKAIQQDQAQLAERKAEAAEKEAAAIARKQQAAQADLALLEAQAKGDTDRVRQLERQAAIQKAIEGGLTLQEATRRQNLQEAIAGANNNESNTDRLRRERQERQLARNVQRALRDIEANAGPAIQANNRPAPAKDFGPELSKKLDKLDDVIDAVENISKAG